MKKILTIISVLPLLACNSDEQNTITVEGELSTSPAVVSQLANAGLMTGSGSIDGLTEATSLSESSTLGRFAVSNDCIEFGSATINVEVEQGLLSASFNECTDPQGNSIDGNLVIQVLDGSLDDGAAVSLSVDYQNLSALSEQFSVNMNGLMEVSLSVSNTLWSYHLESDLFSYSQSLNGAAPQEFSLQNFKFAMTGEVLESEEQADPAIWNYDYYIKNAQGTYHVVSVGDITLAQVGSQQRNGVITIEGENALLTITLVADNESGQAQMSWDLDKDGNEDVTNNISQTEFYAAL